MKTAYEGMAGCSGMPLFKEKDLKKTKKKDNNFSIKEALVITLMIVIPATFFMVVGILIGISKTCK